MSKSASRVAIWRIYYPRKIVVNITMQDGNQKEQEFAFDQLDEAIQLIKEQMAYEESCESVNATCLNCGGKGGWIDGDEGQFVGCKHCGGKGRSITIEG